MAAHAKFSPSAAHRWMRCFGALPMEAAVPNYRDDSFFADEGTAAHELGAWALEQGLDCDQFIGRQIEVGERVFVVDDEMARHVQTYVSAVRERVAAYQDAGAQVELRVEQRVDFSHILGQPDSFGTADAQIVAVWQDGRYAVETHDLKYGRGVEVDAEENEQLCLYALPLVWEFSLLGEVREVTMAIHQPRRGHLSIWTTGVDYLEAFGDRAAHAVREISEQFRLANDGEPLTLNPGEKQCQWCKAKATCPALTQHVLATVADDFVDLTQPIKPQVESALERIQFSDPAHIANCLAAADLIEDWVKAVRARAESDLLAGKPVPGFKLVEGRRGARKWTSADEVENLFKALRLKKEEMYDFSLISPTTAEKLAKTGVIGPRQWSKVQMLVTQSEGKPSVAPASDRRPAISVTPDASDFEVQQ